MVVKYLLVEISCFTPHFKAIKKDASASFFTQLVLAQIKDQSIMQLRLAS